MNGCSCEFSVDAAYCTRNFYGLAVYFFADVPHRAPLFRSYRGTILLAGILSRRTHAPSAGLQPLQSQTQRFRSARGGCSISIPSMRSSHSWGTRLPEVARGKPWRAAPLLSAASRHIRTHTTATLTLWIGGSESNRQSHCSPPSLPIHS